jgi:hypothetical protein
MNDVDRNACRFKPAACEPGQPFMILDQENAIHRQRCGKLGSARQRSCRIDEQGMARRQKAAG